MSMYVPLSVICDEGTSMRRAIHKRVLNRQQYVHVWRFVCAHVCAHPYAHWCRCVCTRSIPHRQGWHRTKQKISALYHSRPSVLPKLEMQQAHVIRTGPCW